MNTLNLYEKKIIEDEEFPIQFFMNSIKKTGEYFWLHWHEHTELHYIIKGSSVFYCNQKKIIAREGSLVVINSNELHRGVVEEKQLEAIVLIFEMSSFSKELAHASIIFENLIKNDELIQKQMYALFKENEEKKIGYKLSSKGMLYELLVYLMRNYAVMKLSESENIRRNKNLIRLNTVIQYIQEYYTQPISNRTLADLVYLSEGRFNHLFKESMGVSPLNYINEIRLKKAKNLLETKEYTVSEVALEVGFSDFNHFGRLFYKKYNCTPSSILKKV